MSSKELCTQLQEAYGFKSVHIHHSKCVICLAKGEVEQLALWGRRDRNKEREEGGGVWKREREEGGGVWKREREEGGGVWKWEREEGGGVWKWKREREEGGGVENGGWECGKWRLGVKNAEGEGVEDDAVFSHVQK